MNVFLISSLIVLVSGIPHPHTKHDYDYSSKVDTNLICRWSGSSPICLGECDEAEHEKSEAKMMSESLTAGERKRFGMSCIYGVKKLCCVNIQNLENGSPDAPHNEPVMSLF